jgi:hypothetical protein
MRFPRAVGWQFAAMAALAPAVSHAQTAAVDDGSAGWVLGLGAQADEHDASSLLGTFQVGVGARTWLTFVAGQSESPSDFADIEANALVLGLDHRFDKVGFTLEAERWGDSGALETADFSGTVYFERERLHLGFGYEKRDIEIPFTVTGPLGGTFHRTAELSADGYSVNGNVALAQRWRMYFGLTEYDYERNLAVVPRIASLNMLSMSTLTLANSFLDHDRWLAVERAFGQATLLNVRAATDKSALDASQLDTLEAAVLFPIGRRIDLEVSIGSGRSDFFDAGLYGGLLFLIYGR